jgi:hypothetical protein
VTGDGTAFYDLGAALFDALDEQIDLLLSDVSFVWTADRVVRDVDGAIYDGILLEQERQ